MTSAGGGLLEGDPTQVAGAIAQQSVQLVQNTVAGTLDSVSRVSETASKGIKALDITETRRAGPRANPPTHALEGFVQGGRTFGTSLLRSFGGIVHDPIVGARQGGVVGAVKGVGSGIIGLVTKPAAGAFEGISLLLSGISASVDPAKASAPRARLPRYLGPDGRLMGFSAREAEGHARMMLLAASYPKAAKQRYVYHCDVFEAVRLPAEDMLDPSQLATARDGFMVVTPPASAADVSSNVAQFQAEEELEAGLTGSERHVAAEQRLIADFISKRPGARLDPIVLAGGTAQGEPVQPAMEEHVTSPAATAAPGGGGGAGFGASSPPPSSAAGRLGPLSSLRSPGLPTGIGNGIASGIGSPLRPAAASLASPAGTGAGGGAIVTRGSLRSYASRPDSILGLPVSESARKSINVKSGHRKLPRFLLARQPDIIRAVERAKRQQHDRPGGAAGEEDLGPAPYVLLITDCMVWLLDARTNRKVWAAGVSQASLALKSNQDAARRIAKAMVTARRRWASAVGPASTPNGNGGSPSTALHGHPLISFLAYGPTISIVSHELKKVRISRRAVCAMSSRSSIAAILTR